MLRSTTEIDWQSRKREVLVHSNTTFAIEFNGLCIVIDSKRSFNHHVGSITYQISAKLGFIQRTCENVYVDYTLKLLYFILVHSKLEYTNLVWRNSFFIQCL